MAVETRRSAREARSLSDSKAQSQQAALPEERCQKERCVFNIDDQSQIPIHLWEWHPLGKTLTSAKHRWPSKDLTLL